MILIFMITNDKELAILELYISNTGYLEECLSYFTKVLIEDNNDMETDIEELEISNFKDEKKKQNLQKK